MRINKLLGIGLIATLGLISCGQRKLAETDLKKLYIPSIVSNTDLGIELQLRGRIIKVQPSRISFSDIDNSNNFRDQSHEFEYVFVDDEYGDMSLLIYPYSKGILERGATIRYRAMIPPKISSLAFIKTYVSPNIQIPETSVINIEADGIIVPGGISYR
ncbi:hypothetical protein J4405_00805 [Candidatus Woesearchaeota archaeon]|nr:hypothetical protein [Candidatus Woesearchaeota archaeon]